MNNNNFLSRNAHWLLRATIVSVFLYHGTLKFMDLEGFVEMLPVSYLQVFLVASGQIGGSLLLIAGGFNANHFSDLLTRIGAVMNIPAMIGAITLIHWGRWNFLPSETHPIGGMEFQAVLILIMLYLALTGNQKVVAVGSQERKKQQSKKRHNYFTQRHIEESSFEWAPERVSTIY